MQKIAKAGVLAVAIAAFVAFTGAMSAVAYSAADFGPSTLKVGSTGAYVTNMQTALNMASCGGATLSTDGRFGPGTKAAVMAFQSSKMLTADGLVGGMTKAKLAECSTMGGNTNGGSSSIPGCLPGYVFSATTGQSCGTNNGGSNNGGNLSGGETSITDVNVDDADDDTLNEGADETPVASIEFDVEDADAKLVRADIIFQADDANDEVDPWKVFDKVYLMNGDDTIASVSTDDEDAWDDVSSNLGSNSTDAYRLRINNINEMFNEDDNAEIWVAVDVASSVDGADSSDANWLVAVETNGLRFIDGAGVDTEEDAGSDEASFSIEEAGQDSEFSVTEATDSPDASSLEVKSNATSTQTIALFNVDADEDGGDVKINDFPVVLTGSVALNTFVEDVYIEIDGQQYSADGSVGTSTSQTFTFDDIDDDDVVLDSGNDMDVTVKVKFKSQGNNQANYANGVTIYAAANLASSDVEDADSGDDVGNVNGTATADTFTLFSDGIMVDLTGGETPTIQENQDGDNVKLTYTVTFKVTAFGDDVFIPKTVAETSNASAGLIYEIEDSSGNVNTTTTATNGSIQSGADEVNNYYRVEEGSTETFTAAISVTKGTAAAGFYHVQLNAVQFDTVNQTGPLTGYTLSPENDFDTNDGQIDA